MGSINFVFAAPIFNASPSSIKAKPLNSQRETFYTDFSGTWESPQCMGTENLILTIEHDEDFIQLGSTESPIGALQTESIAGTINLRFKEPTSSIYSIEWANNHSQLIFRGVTVVKPVDRFPASDNALELKMHYNTLSLNKEGQLIFKMKGVEYRDLQSVDEWDMAPCVFNKITMENHSKISQ